MVLVPILQPDLELVHVGPVALLAYDGLGVGRLILVHPEIHLDLITCGRQGGGGRFGSFRFYFNLLVSYSLCCVIVHLDLEQLYT